MIEPGGRSNSEGRTGPPRSVPLGAALLLFVFVRAALLPANLSETPSFSHDSGYIGIVARNLLAGRGFINDANWLLFLNPPSLPMYFHNANPLYPTLTAGVMWLTGWEPALAAALLSIIGDALVGAGVYWLVRAFSRGAKLPIACAALAVALPASWRVSHAITPDALATGLVLCVMAIVVHARQWWHWVAAGAVFGLAWLTRSSVALAVPPIAVWMLWRHGMRRGLVAGAILALAGLVVISPWLARNARVRGGLFASDEGYYWLLDYNASRSHRETDQYFRSLEPPPSAREVLQRDAGGLAKFAVRGVGVTVRHAVGGLASWDRTAAFVLAIVTLAAGMVIVQAGWARRPETIAGVLLWCLTIGALAVRGPSSEPRYFSVANTLLAIALLAPFAVELQGWRRWLRAPIVAYVALVLLPQDVSISRMMRAPDQTRLGFKSYALSVAATMPDSSAAVSNLPYIFSYYTGRRALSPPYPDKDALLQVMARYGASVVLLPTDSLTYYYPGGPAALAPQLRVERELGRFTLLRHTPSSE